MDLHRALLIFGIFMVNSMLIPVSGWLHQHFHSHQTTYGGYYQERERKPKFAILLLVPALFIGVVVLVLILLAHRLLKIFQRPGSDLPMMKVIKGPPSWEGFLRRS